MPYLCVDEFFPVLIGRRAGAVHASDVADMLSWVDGHMAGDRRITVVYDAGTDPNGRPDAEAREVGGNWFRKRQVLLQRRCIGIDFAFVSPLQRGAITAVFWIARPPVPYALHSSCRAAVANAIERARLAREMNAAAVATRLDELEQRMRRGGRT